MHTLLHTFTWENCMFSRLPSSRERPNGLFVWKRPVSSWNRDRHGNCSWWTDWKRFAIVTKTACFDSSKRFSFRRNILKVPTYLFTFSLEEQWRALFEKLLRYFFGSVPPLLIAKEVHDNVAWFSHVRYKTIHLQRGQISLACPGNMEISKKEREDTSSRPIRINQKWVCKT